MQRDEVVSVNRYAQHRNRFVLRALTLAVAAGTAGGVEAARLGGATVLSRAGEPLRATVSLLATPAELAAARATLSAPLTIGGAPDATIERLGLRALVDASGVVRIESDRPLEAGTLELRLALEVGAGAVVRHYRLTPAPARVTAAPPPAATGASGTTVRVRRGDTAWGIARRLWPQRRDMDAAVAALVAANPHAFVDGDADRLLAGVDLVVPGVVAATDPRAIATSRTPAAATPPARSPAAAATHAAAPVPDEPPAQAAATPADGAPLDAAGGDGAGAPAAGLADAAKPAGGVSPQPPAVDLAAVDRRLAAARAFLEARRSGRHLAPAVAVQRAPEPVSAHAPDEAAPAGAPAGVAAPAMPAPVRADVASAGGLSPVRVAAGLALLMLLALADRWRRRRLASGGPAVDPARLDAIRRKASRAGSGVAAVDHGMDQGPGPDPLAKGMAAADESVEVGRYDDAVRTLERVLAETTNTHRALLRLAELHYLTGQADDFARLAERLHREFRPRLDDAEWARLQEMGRRLCPDHPLFGGPTLVQSAS